MKHIDIQIKNSFDISGSLNIPVVENTGSIPSGINTGSIFFNKEDNLMYIASASQYFIVGAQADPIPPGTNVEYLVVAGGGSGGRGSARSGGGGGAGGYLSSSLSSIESGSEITVTVGAGGAAVSSDGAGSDGGDSSIASSTGTNFTTVTSTGGGGGGYPGSGGDGGSGGGGAHGSQVGGSGTAGQGFDGGDGIGESPYSGGGGGGASEVGEDSSASVAGDGGNGKSSSITGTSTTRAGGGGGGGGGTAGSGGTGGGGAGSSDTGTSGTANTGGGGGGARSISGAGGSGVVILAYPSSSMNAAGGIVGNAGDGRKYHQFNGSGTFKTGNTGSFQIHTTNLVMHIDAGNFDSRGTSSTGYDLTSYGNDINLSGQSGGSLTNNPWWNCDGTGGLADFDRNGVSAASGVAHTGYGNFTGRTNVGWCIDFWIKTTASGGWASGGKTIIGRNDGDIYANITIYNNKANWNHYNGSWQNESSTTSINDGVWHHCTFNNHSDETIDIWVDGVKENDGAASTVNPDSRYFKMDSLGRGYNGENTAMDFAQCRVYDATLTDSQILQNYNATKTNFI